jgi:hypothetical protein
MWQMPSLTPSDFSLAGENVPEMSMTSTDKAIFTGDALIIVNCGVYYI